jgi:FkbM family methyltransferase
MQKIIIIADWLINYITKEPYIFAKKLEMHYNWKIIKLSLLDIQKIKKMKSIVLCITYDSFDISLLKCENIIIIYKIDDLYPYKDIRKKCINYSDLVIGPYQYLFKKEKIIQMYPSIQRESYHIPYSAIDLFYKNIEFNNTPKEKIFVSGAIHDVYPLRKYALKYQEYIEVLEHPSYNKHRHDIIDEKYYKKLNTYLCCFTDASIYNYVLLKVFEICSVGSLLLCEDSIKDELYRLGFKDNINYISCNKENLESKMKWVLHKKNRKLVDNMRLKGMNLVRNYHNTNNRTEVFNLIVNNKFFKKTHIAVFNNNYYFTPDKIQVAYINSGRAEPYSGNIKIVKNYIKKNNRCNTYLDIGVNIATHSIVYSKIFKNVISFEPDQYNYNQSKENLKINNVTNVKLLNVALGSKKGFVKTLQHSNHSRGCIFTKLTNNDNNTKQITLDSLHLNNIDYIKIDVEGNELDVLKGSIETIKRNKPIIEFEYNSLSHRYNVKYKDIRNFLTNLNYKFDNYFESNYYFIYDSN